MSLDVYLSLPGASVPSTGSGIFVRESGGTVEITREEWDRRNPGREPVVATPPDTESDEVYSANITHNLNKMADAAGIYEALWRPGEIGITKAAQLVEPLRVGLALLKSDPPRFEKHNASNGWGKYEHLVPFVEKYLAVCEMHPNATVRVWR